MKTNNQFSFKELIGAVITAVLVVVPLVVLSWMMEAGEPGAFLGTFTYVLSGQLFNEGWNRVHAGITLDQPTIGKWYFWFTAFTVLNSSYMMIMRQFCVREVKLRYWIFAVGVSFLCLFLVCLLTIPFWWLIQYIGAMGWTARRFCGLLYGICGYVLVLWFWYRAVVRIRQII